MKCRGYTFDNNFLQTTISAFTYQAQKTLVETTTYPAL
jgi:hypothetical protein